MAGTPDSLPETPPRAAAPDLLTDVLRSIRLNGAVFLSACFTAPFGVRDPKSYAERTPMARLRHVSILHLIVEGECEIESAGIARSLHGGDLVFMPLPNAYQCWSGKPERMADASEIVRPGTVDGLWLVDHGGGGARVRMVCGFIESAEFLFAPVFRGLPPLIVERATEDHVGALIASTVREIVERTEAAAPGSHVLLGRLMELLFIELLRRHVARLPEGATGWFAAVRDPLLGRALALLHAEPAREWTIDEIAQRCTTSRTVLAERFNALLGRPPFDYLTAWRMQLAAERLRNSRDTALRIAEAVGYDSESSFSRAFKRVTGMSPGQWRDMA